LPADHPLSANVLRLRRLGIDTYQEPVVYMSADSPVCHSEGWTAQARIRVTNGKRSLIATLNVVTRGLLAADEVSLSEAAWLMLDAHEGNPVTVTHPEVLGSLRHVRAKVYGRRLAAEEIDAVVRDIAGGRYSAIEIAAFVAACAGGRLDTAEVVELTRAMVAVGERLTWGPGPIVDKHSVGGLPGNRTTLIVVPIVAAAGLVMPKTSSRAITSPAGTADAMETLAPVNLDVAAMRRVVDAEGGCIVWGGSVRLSPADDVIIAVERPLDIDSEGQLIASVLSKKIAAGSTHVVIDMPVGLSAKVRGAGAAEELSNLFVKVGQAMHLTVRTVQTDGSQPVGRGIGPALEALDALDVLRGDPEAPEDLRERALLLAGAVLELGGRAPADAGPELARELLDSGAALRKFEAICEAQGGMRDPPRARFSRDVLSRRSGVVTAIDNRRLARLAKLAGAPRMPSAGLELHARVGSTVEVGRPLFTLHAGAPGELDYALRYAAENMDVLAVAEGGA
jgi:thymidine phosphorylase